MCVLSITAHTKKVWKLMEGTSYIVIRRQNKVSWPTVVDGDPKAPLSIAISPICERRRYSFPRNAPLTLDPYFIMLRVKLGGIEYYFLCLSYDSTWDWIPVSGTFDEQYITVLNWKNSKIPHLAIINSFQLATV